MTCQRPAEVYRYFDKAGTLLYIGKSLCSVIRALAHREKGAWYGAAVTMTIERFDSIKEAGAAETKAIKNEGPLHNVHHNRPKKVNKAKKIQPAGRDLSWCSLRVKKQKRVVAIKAQWKLKSLAAYSVRFIGIAEVEERTTLAKEEIHRLMDIADFPDCVWLSKSKAGKAVWVEREIDFWVQGLRP